MNDSFRDRLLKMEQATPALKERYDKEIQAMLEKRISGIRRWVWLGSAVMGVGFAVLFGTLAIITPAEFPMTGRIGFAAGALFGIGWAVLGWRVFRRSSINLKIDSGAAAGMAWGLPIILLTLFMVSAPDSIVGLRMIISGLVFLVMGLAFLLRHVIEQSELKTREKLLEIEYRLAELVETAKLGKT
jgi:MFS family permease